MTEVFSWNEFVLGAPESIKSPVFSEPWEADVFAILVALERKKLFTWSEWAEELGRELASTRGADDSDDGRNYYEDVLGALEKLLINKQIVSRDALNQYRQGWSRVANRTPHGQPLELTDADLRG